MLTTGIQNPPEPLARAQAAYHDGTARLAPANADRPARRVEHCATSVQFILHDPDAARRLHALTKDPRTVPQLGTLLPPIRWTAMALSDGDFGNCGRAARQPAGDGPADPVGRAMVTALLDPARVREADVPVPSSCGSWPDDRELRPPDRPALAERPARLTGLRSRP
jgi:hypothetical protein